MVIRLAGREAARRWPRRRASRAAWSPSAWCRCRGRATGSGRRRRLRQPDQSELAGRAAELIDRHTARSAPEVAEAMAVGCRRSSATDLAVSTVGYAGPRQAPGKPVGSGLRRPGLGRRHSGAKVQLGRHPARDSEPHRQVCAQHSAPASPRRGVRYSEPRGSGVQHHDPDSPDPRGSEYLTPRREASWPPPGPTP